MLQCLPAGHVVGAVVPKGRHVTVQHHIPGVGRIVEVIAQVLGHAVQRAAVVYQVPGVILGAAFADVSVIEISQCCLNVLAKVNKPVPKDLVLDAAERRAKDAAEQCWR